MSSIIQVLLNLILNAIQALDDQGSLDIGARADGPQLLLTIRDTGKGIPAENLSKIFDPFFTTKPVGQGTGLGLAVVKTMIEEHNGSIAVQSRVGEGTTVTIRLPITHTHSSGAASSRG